MSSLLYVCLIVLSLSLPCLSQIQVLEGSPVFQYNITLTPGSNSYRTSFTVPNGTLNVASVPCFGEYDWFIGVNFEPNRTTKSFAFLFSETGNAYSAAGSPSQDIPYTFYIYAESNSNYDGIGAEFDIIADVEDPSVTLIPIPGNDGKVTGKLDSGGGSGTLKWTSTGNNEDVYELYSHLGKNPVSGGFFPYTACGVRRYFQNFTQGSITNNNDGTYTADVNDLDVKNPLTVTVVAQRINGYAASYTSFVFNGASTMYVSYYLLVIVFALLLVVV